MPKRSDGAVAQQQPQVRPGELFGLPSFTRWTEQYDVNNALTASLAQSSSTPQTGYLPFRTTDIVFAWMWSITITQTGLVSAAQTSKYFPWNYVQQFQIAITNLYDVIDVQSGIDLAIFNTIRPFRTPVNSMGTVEYNVPTSWPQSNSVATAEANLNNFATSTAVTTTSAIPLNFEVPMCQWFDEYFELDRDGHPLAVANRVPVSPLYMSGTARNVFPVTTWAAADGTNIDLSPFHTLGGFTSVAIKHTWKRVGIYGTTNKMEMPPVFNWRYALVSRRVALGGVSQVDIPLKNVVNNGGGGQVLMVFVRFWDPSASTSGAPIGWATSPTVKEGKLTYGSGLIRFDDVPAENQQRLIQQHNAILPLGVWVWDLALDEDQRFTNARALNLYTTDVTIHFDFTGALSSTAYCVVGVEYLTYVLDQPVLV